ncbi:hypothetical protein [Marinoscillum furvescens]|uniref:Outer membrane protein with beta-barrel domain n=1 Tax=Marinoscillum furvescens DSM 4134 TaxID=1122208 RepID=A0A3D9L2D0_MARFU|nr:hypothetical protein [Marinoscillum furvescens]RED98899.1 hypothetical protein C7460_10991 [Marinoscillum furvescens DSM 4134]
MKKVIFIGLIFSSLLAIGQTEEDDYDTEITWGVNKNTNSGLVGGVIFKLARRKKENTFVTYGVELMNVKHPKEWHYPSATTGTRFVWGKANYLYAIRGQYGRERVLFKKAPQQGVQISAVAAAGPTIGVVAPYYILYNGNYVQFDPERHQSFNSIQGSGKLFQGLGESSIVPGANAKAGLAFEFGAFKNNVAGVEVGASLEAYPKKIIIVPTQENRAVFTALYFSIYWGTRR